MEVKITHLDRVKFAIQSSVTYNSLRPTRGKWRRRLRHDAAGIAARVAGILRGLLRRAVSEDPQSRGDRREVSVTAEKLKRPPGSATSACRLCAPFRSRRQKRHLRA